MALSSLTKNLNNTIEKPIKEDGVWIFSDTECNADKKVCYNYTSLFQAFQDKEFVVLLQNDANTELSKEIYKNIIKSGLHRATIKTPYFTMSGCCRMDYKEDRSPTSINFECQRESCG